VYRNWANRHQVNFVVSDNSTKNEFTLSTRFVLDSPVLRQQHGTAAK
jgi:hypothetical protein